MKFSCDLQLLSDVVSRVSLAISARSTIPALEGVLLQCSDNYLQLSGYDLEIGIIRSIHVDQEEEGGIILNAQLFGEMLRKMRGPEVHIETDERQMTVITDDDTQFHILGVSKEEFPSIPSFSEEVSFSIPDPFLKKMINQTIFATAQNQVQSPILCGSLFDVRDGILHIVSVDGYRVALSKMEVDTKKKFYFVVPSKTLSEISKLLVDSEERITKVSVSEKHVVFEIGEYYIISRLLEGEFIDYRSAIPKESSTKLQLDATELRHAIERVSIIINLKNNTPVKMNAADGMIKLSCESTLGEGKDQFVVQMEGKPIQIAFNNRYMIEALRHCDQEETLILLNGSVEPIKIVPKEGDDYLFLVLPVRLKTDI